MSLRGGRFLLLLYTLNFNGWRSERGQGTAQNTMTLTTYHFFECSLRNQILPFVPFDQILKTFRQNELNFVDLEQERFRPPIEKLKHFALQHLHCDAFSLGISCFL